MTNFIWEWIEDKTLIVNITRILFGISSYHKSYWKNGKDGKEKQENGKVEKKES